MQMGGLHQAQSAIAAVREKITQEIARAAACSIVRLVDLILEDACMRRASDVHFEPCTDGILVRFRIDGALCDAYVLPRAMQHEVLARIKILAGLRIDAHHKAQDGRFAAALSGVAPFDVRVSVVPTYHGENAVMRILVRSAETPTLAKLGFTARNAALLERTIARPFGLVLATGHTLIGNTTTLYTLLTLLRRPEASIITIEDPIEYAIPGVSQIQVSSRAGMTFAEGLRSILRQDPDVIMVGEIRDRETAALAVNAALTGHLVLSTLHTNDAPTTLVRLLDMGVEPYLAASTVSLCIGQRLVRRVCIECAEPRHMQPEEIAAIHPDAREEAMHPHARFLSARGCDACDTSGFRERIGIHEVMEMNPALHAAVMRHASIGEIRTIARDSGMTTMLQDGIRKAARGMTTLEEVLRVHHE